MRVRVRWSKRVRERWSGRVKERWSGDEGKMRREVRVR